jgi:hypothetical protein
MNARVVLTLVALLSAGPAWAQSKGQLRIPEFSALADKASETVTVTLDANLLGMAARFLSNEDPDQAKAKKLVSSLTGIYVRPAITASIATSSTCTPTSTACCSCSNSIVTAGPICLTTHY